MSDVAVFVLIVAAMAGIGVALGMIVAGRLERRTAPRSAVPKLPADPPAPPQEDEP